ncbi:MAG: 3-phosphoshikimate 1-carboxyvinyltransferase [Planctomycetaceae bacterium]|nr:3-phosphoshikimate 1-carboxyvinyltransferase [Planctomycetaceae bacterium]
MNAVEPRPITPKGALNAVVTPPGSKSITNRALLLAALAESETDLIGVLQCEDTQVMFDALRQTDRFRLKKADIYVGNSGTTARFLTAVLAFSGGEYRIYGKPRMHERPVKDLVDALRILGGNVAYEDKEGFPPVRICPTEPEMLCRGTSGVKEVTISGSVSSQFLSALLMAAPLAAAKNDILIRVSGELVSKPYAEMTLRMMESFGVKPETLEPEEPFRRAPGFSSSFRIPRGAKYRSPGTYRIEPDASAASYFFAAAAVCGGQVTVQGLSRRSLQGDVNFVNCLEQMGCNINWSADSITVSRPPEKVLRGITVDMNAISDTAQTLAVAALFAEGSTEIRNIEHVRCKETDRIADLARELRKFGAEVEEFRDGLRIIPGAGAAAWQQRIASVTVETYDDHRMAMSFAVAGLRLPGVRIADSDCCKKTFPDFFEVLENVT